MATVMTGVPSIVMGLFIYLIWTMRFGYSAFGGALALACLMLPVVIGSTEQMLRLVPTNLREAAYALGTSKSRTILTVVLPAALPGIVSGSLLAVARAAGETAPLLFAVGAANAYNPHLFAEANTALSHPDLRQRDVVVRRRAGPRVGRRAHAGAADVHRHAGRADVHRARMRSSGR